MDSDARRYELERLVAMGFAHASDPSPRLEMTARMLEPSAWTDHAQEQIDWCTRHRMTGSPTHFGTMHMNDRRLALIRAELLLRALDRQAAGLPDLAPLDAGALSKRLGERWWEISRQDPRRHVSKKAADAVFFMKKVDGVPAPDAVMADDGSVTLTWSEDDRSAVMRIDLQGGMTMSIGSGPPEAISFQEWKTDAPRRIAEATSWIYFEGSEPEASSAKDAA